MARVSLSISGRLAFDDRLAAQDTIPPEGNLQIGDVVKIAKAELFRLGQKRFRHDRELS